MTHIAPPARPDRPGWLPEDSGLHRFTAGSINLILKLIWMRVRADLYGSAGDRRIENVFHINNIPPVTRETMPSRHVPTDPGGFPETAAYTCSLLVATILFSN